MPGRAAAVSAAGAGPAGGLGLTTGCAQEVSQTSSANRIGAARPPAYSRRADQHTRRPIEEIILFLFIILTKTGTGNEFAFRAD